MSKKKSNKPAVITQSNKHTDQEMKELCLKYMKYSNYDPQKALKAFGEGIQKMRQEKDEKRMRGILADLNENSNKVLNALSLESKYKLLESVPAVDRSFALQMSRDLELEFEVKSPTEKALVQMATLAFCRIQRYAQLCWRHDKPNSISNEANQLISIYAKELDRANRQFITTIQVLKQFKAPPLNIRVNTQNAFVAHNQQNISNINPEKNAPQ
jgi:hypothetical protein